MFSNFCLGSCRQWHQTEQSKAFTPKVSEKIETALTPNHLGQKREKRATFLCSRTLTPRTCTAASGRSSATCATTPAPTRYFLPHTLSEDSLHLAVYRWFIESNYFETQLIGLNHTWAHISEHSGCELHVVGSNDGIFLEWLWFTVSNSGPVLFMWKFWIMLVVVLVWYALKGMSRAELS